MNRNNTRVPDKVRRTRVGPDPWTPHGAGGMALRQLQDRNWSDPSAPRPLPSPGHPHGEHHSVAELKMRESRYGRVP